MHYQFKISSTLLNLAYEFGKCYERFEMLPIENVWLQRLVDIQSNTASFAAVTIDKSSFQELKKNLLPNGWQKLDEKLPAPQRHEYKHYRNALKQIKKQDSYSLDTIESLHRQAIGMDTEEKYRFRSENRTIDKLILENNVYRTIKQKVQTDPGDIMERLGALVNWLNDEAQRLNPIIAASLAHVKIADIHPYPDGNGRLARLLDNQLLIDAGYNHYQFIPLEGYFLDTAERYFEIIEKTIETADYTEWIEYYATGLLTAVNETTNLLKSISGGALDLQNRKIIELTDKEAEALDMLASSTETNGAGIARQMGVTRQSVNQLLHKLRDKGLIEKTGTAASSKFSVVG